MTDPIRPLTADEIASLTAEELEQLQADLEALYWASGRDSLLSYSQMIEVPGAPVDEPEPDTYYSETLRPAAHHKLLVEAIQNVADGTWHDVDGVMALAPPGSAKSTWLSVIGASWLLGRKPGTNVIGASYGQDLANRFGRRVRTVARSPIYSRIMGATVVGDNAAVDSWSLTNGSDYRAAGMGAAVTGFRADCLFGGTVIQTLDGPRTIADIYNNSNGCKVLSYEGSLRQTVYRRVVAVARRNANELWRIRTGSGRVVEATGNHRFYTERGWTPASALAVGDVLLRTLPEASQTDRRRGSEEDATVLQQAMRNARQQSGAWFNGSALHELRNSSAWETWEPSVLGGMPKRHLQENVVTEPPTHRGEDVRNVREGVSPQVSRDGGTLLLDVLQKCWPLNADQWRVQSELAAWERPQPISGGERQQVPFGAAGSHEARPLLCDLWRGQEAAGASRRRGQHEQRRDEYRYALRPVPHGAAWSRAGEAVSDVVAVVERVRRDCFVYDIQVEETECFFANGILVHNCLLIDDPIKGREEADSQVIRDKVWNGLQDDLFTRLKPGGKIIVCLTHWHQDDPAGRILGEDWKGQSGLWRGTDGRLWHIINLPMIAEHKDDPLGRKPGEMLWPEWYRESEVKRLQDQAAKGGTMSRTWASLYQQRPAPADGSILLKSYWKEWKKAEPPECDLTILTYDTAFEEDELNDPSAMTHWGTFRSTSKKSSGEEYEHNHAILLGAWSDHVDSADLADLIEEHYRLLKPDIILIEKRASGATVVSELRRRRLPVRPWLPRGKPGAKGKVPRAHGVAMMLESGAVWRFKGAAIDRTIDQCAMFPNAKNDDLVDCCTMALSWLRDRFAFQSADDEPDAQEIRDIMNARFDARKGRPPKRLYGGEVLRPVQNERRDDDELVRNMTEGTRRRLYGGTL